MRILLIFLCVLFSFSANSAVPTCHESSSGNYCTYTGLVNRIYINDSGMILIYFDEVMHVEAAAAVGISISKGNAATFVLQSNIEFSKLLYSTALAARASGTPISMQMRGAQNGYLKIDRIWM
jgi:hypothetical protein